MNKLHRDHTVRVVFYSGTWPPNHQPNGIATYIDNARAGLSARGVDSRVLAGEIGPNESWPDIVKVEGHASLPFARRTWEKLRLRWSRKDYIRATSGRNLARAAIALQKQWPFDLLEIEESFGFAAITQSIINIPTIVRLHGPWFMVGKASGLHTHQCHQRIADEGRAIRQATIVSAPSHQVLQDVRSYYGLELLDAVVIPNAGPEVNRSSTWKPQSCDRDTILFVGRFDHLKGGDTIVDAFQILATTNKVAKLIFVGPDRGIHNKDGRLESFSTYLDRALQDPGIRQRITWLGHLPAAEIAPLRRRAAVTVVCSRYESLSMTAVEAMAYGCPLVATRVGGIPELTLNGSAARLIDPGDAAGLAQAITSLLHNIAEATQLAQTARLEYENALQPSAVLDRQAAFYQQVKSQLQAKKAPC